VSPAVNVDAFRIKQLVRTVMHCHLRLSLGTLHADFIWFHDTMKLLCHLGTFKLVVPVSLRIPNMETPSETYAFHQLYSDGITCMRSWPGGGVDRYEVGLYCG
jgi:hypothetical protein